MVKNPPVNTGDLNDMGSIPGSGRSPGERNGNPVEYSCLESDGKRSLAGYSCKESDMTKGLSTHALSLAEDFAFLLIFHLWPQNLPTCSCPISLAMFIIFYKAEMILLHFSNFFLYCICVCHCFPICLNADCFNSPHLFFFFWSLYILISFWEEERWESALSISSKLQKLKTFIIFVHHLIPSD